MLSALLPYYSGVGIDVRWLAIDGNNEFFDVTKRLHNFVHETPGDGGALDTRARAIYDETLAPVRDRVTVVRPARAVATA